MSRAEFRTLLVHLKQYYEIYIMFNEIDVGAKGEHIGTSGDRTIAKKEFVGAARQFAEWGYAMGDAAAEFASLDNDGSGALRFDEFAAWARRKRLHLPEAAGLIADLDDEFPFAAHEFANEMTPEQAMRERRRRFEAKQQAERLRAIERKTQFDWDDFSKRLPTGRDAASEAARSRGAHTSAGGRAGPTMRGVRSCRPMRRVACARGAALALALALACAAGGALGDWASEVGRLDPSSAAPPVQGWSDSPVDGFNVQRDD